MTAMGIRTVLIQTVHLTPPARHRTRVMTLQVPHGTAASGLSLAQEQFSLEPLTAQASAVRSHANLVRDYQHIRKGPYLLPQ